MKLVFRLYCSTRITLPQQRLITRRQKITQATCQDGREWRSNLYNWRKTNTERKKNLTRKKPNNWKGNRENKGITERQPRKGKVTSNLSNFTKLFWSLIKFCHNMSWNNRCHYQTQYRTLILLNISRHAHSEQIKFSDFYYLIMANTNIYQDQMIKSLNKIVKHPKEDANICFFELLPTLFGKA
jgi:hypothetical protein